MSSNSDSETTIAGMAEHPRGSSWCHEVEWPAKPGDERRWCWCGSQIVAGIGQCAECQEDVTTECPKCHGKGGGIALVSGEIEPCQCSLCHNAGKVRSQVAAWWRTGDEARRNRLRRGESGEEVAARIGCTRREVADMEHGRADPARLTA